MLLFAIAVMACNQGETAPNDGSGGGGEGGEGGEGGGGQGGGGDGGTIAIGPSPFDCGLTPDCIQDAGHLGGVMPDALRCGGELIASGEPAVVLLTAQPGPYPTHQERLNVLLGDGTTIVHWRARCETDDACAGQTTSEWSYFGPAELCDVDVDPADISGCDQPDGACSWAGGSVANCATLDATWSCAQLPAGL
jgi:hypothetical protein